MKADPELSPGRHLCHARCLAVLVVSSLMCCAHPTRVARAPAGGEAILRVATYNLNYGLVGDGETLAALAATKAEVVFLQETSPGWERALRATLASTWPHQAYLHAAAAGGMAVLSKSPFTVKNVLPNPRQWFDGLRVVAQTSIGPVQALVVHLHPPITEDGDWIRGYFSTGPARRAELLAWLPTLEPDLPTLVVGDFNEGTSGQAVKLLEQRGLRTVLPEFHPQAKTWRWRVGPLLLSAQFDHLAYDQRLEPLNAQALQRGNSDHLPVVAEFILAGNRLPRPPAPHGSSLSVSLH